MHVIQHVLPHLAGATVAIGLVVHSTKAVRKPRRAPVAHSTPEYSHKPSITSSHGAAQLLRAATTVPTVGAHHWGLLGKVHQVLLLACFLGASMTLLTEVSTYVVASTAAAAVSVAASWYYTEHAKPQAAPSPQAVELGTLKAAAGTWVKDAKRSTSMDPFFTLFAVSPLLRKAAILMRGFEVQVTEEALVTRQLCALPWFHVVERFPLDGSAAIQKRRDMRSGPQSGRLLSANGEEIVMRVEWDAPMAGFALDKLQLAEDGAVLRHTAYAQVGEQSAEFVSTYVRKGA